MINKVRKLPNRTTKTESIPFQNTASHIATNPKIVCEIFVWVISNSDKMPKLDVLENLQSVNSSFSMIPTTFVFLLHKVPSEMTKFIEKKIVGVVLSAESCCGLFRNLEISSVLSLHLFQGLLFYKHSKKIIRNEYIYRNEKKEMKEMVLWRYLIFFFCYKTMWYGIVIILHKLLNIHK